MAIPVSSGTHPRLEISALQQDEEQFSLFIQALNNIMDHDYKFEGSDAVNWQQLGVFDAPPPFFLFLSLYLTDWGTLAGIHGMPYQQWKYVPSGHSLRGLLIELIH